MSDKPLNIVWRRQVLEAVLETSFIRHVLLSKINRPQRWMAIEEGDGLPLMDDTLVVSFGDPVTYFKAAKSRGLKNIGFFQVGDEKGDSPCASHKLADYVLRNYHFPHQLAHHPAKTTWVPNGWGRGVGPVQSNTHLCFADRTLPAFFSGFVGQDQDQIDDRQKLLKIVQQNQVQALMATTTGFGLGLGPAAYSAHMGNARFALIPRGRSEETIRLYDALEHGAIPVVIDGPWLHAKDGLGAVGTPPLLFLNDWSELPAAMAPYGGQIAPEQMAIAENQRKACVDWWHRLQDHYADEVAKLING